MTLDELPVDAWPAIARCLTGVSLFDLARVSTWSWQSFSQDAYWRDRLTVEEANAHASKQKEEGNDDNDRGNPTITALQRYMRMYSLQFHGLGSKDTPVSPSRDSCVEVPHFYHKAFRQGLPFSFDVWFCLLDDRDEGSDNHEMHTGGILFSAQSVSYEGDERPPLLWQFAVVSSDRKLFCSVLDEKRPEIASNLELHRWYHLTLSYDNQTQIVYLDGQLVSTSYGDLYSEWWFVIAAYVGTGQVRAGDQYFPEPEYSGWYPFNGLIDQFRWWKRALSSEEIRVLAQEGSFEFGEDEQPRYSLKRDLFDLATLKGVCRVGCSRPKEKAVELQSRKPERGSVKEAEKEPVDSPEGTLRGHNAKSRDTKAPISLADYIVTSSRCVAEGG